MLTKFEKRYIRFNYKKNGNPFEYVLDLNKTNIINYKGYFLTNPNIWFLRSEKISNLIGEASYNIICSNPEIDFKFLLKNLDKKQQFIWELLSVYVDIKYIEMYPEFDWNYDSMCSNPTLTPQFFEKYLKFKFNHYHFNNELCLNENFSIEWIIKFFHNYNICINWRFLSERHNINETDIEKYIDKPFNYVALSQNKNISLTFIKNHIDKDWDWELISSRVYESDIVNNPNLPWKLGGFLYNTNLSIEFITKNYCSALYFLDNFYPVLLFGEDITISDESLDYFLNILETNKNNISPSKYSYILNFLSMSITQKQYEKYNLDWNTLSLSVNKNIDLDKISDKLDFITLSRNANLTKKFLHQNRDKTFNHISLINNSFLTDKYCLNKNLRKDIERRKENTFKSLNYIDLKYVIKIYVGYE